jgi:RNA polymerase sigma-70 factor (ECF subfamily)
MLQIACQPGGGVRTSADSTNSPGPISAWTAEQVFHAYAPRVYSLARRMLSNDADAEDVTQDVLLQVVRKLDTFRGDAELATWLHRVTVNAALAHRRRQARRPEQHLDVSLDCVATHAGSDGWVPDRKTLDHELRQHLERAIARLPEMYRDVFVLADVEELPNAEIGRLLGLSLAAVKSRLHRARLMVRDALAPYMDRVVA